MNVIAVNEWSMCWAVENYAVIPCKIKVREGNGYSWRINNVLAPTFNIHHFKLEPNQPGHSLWQQTPTKSNKEVDFYLQRDAGTIEW